MAGLYGILHSNREEPEFWTKNNFNSCFPAALANYMRTNNLPVNYIELKLDETGQEPVLKTSIRPLSVDKLFNIEGKTFDEIQFLFEHQFAPFKKYSKDKLSGIDLIIAENKISEGKQRKKLADEDYLAALEVKLTVVPDNTTKSEAENIWGSEIVFRSPTMQYCVFSMAQSLESEKENVVEILQKKCDKVATKDWAEDSVRLSFPDLKKACDELEEKYYSKQKPLVMQPIWKTQGQKGILQEGGAFDIFVWSDFAFTRLFLENPLTIENGHMNRQNRALARFVRCMYEWSESGRVSYDTMRKMEYGHLNDKEFSVQGKTTIKHMGCPNLSNPRIPATALYEIILDGGEKLLMPERRLDQSVLYYTMSHPRPDNESQQKTDS